MGKFLRVVLVGQQVQQAEPVGVWHLFALVIAETMPNHKII